MKTETTVNGIDLFRNALLSWCVEIGEKSPNTFKRTLTYKGQPIKVVWSPEVSDDLRVFHGDEAEGNLVGTLLGEVFKAIMVIEAGE